MILILFSKSYPYEYGGESNFLDAEVKRLVKVFERVVVVPEKREGEIFNNGLEAEVDTRYAALLKRHNNASIFLYGIRSPLFYSGSAEKSYPRFSLTALRRLTAFAGKAELTRQWVEGWIREQGVNASDCLFYTYWFDQAAAGIGLAKKQFPQLRVVSRAHGYDIYEEQYYTPPFWPCRWSVLPMMSKIFPDSQAGTDYLRERYGHDALYETSLLGVTDPGAVNQPSSDGTFRIISCSMIRPEKRVELLLDCLRHAAAQRPNQRFEWHHIGNGASRDELQQAADSAFPPNARAFFPGYADNDALMKLYREQNFDAFINISSTEGTPVSIMEAISFGIPVIATAVGGNREIVSEENGILLSENPTPQEVSAAVFSLLDNPQSAQNKRDGSRAVWNAKYNADANFSEFAQRLKQIRLEP
jgi:glycosyltransferase involved in cell wall biosynthesis